jgi:hypothetical protein
LASLRFPACTLALPVLEAAIATERELAEDCEREAAFWSEEAQAIKAICLEEYAEEIEEMGGNFPSRRQAYLRWRAFPGGHAWQDEYGLYFLINEYHDYRDIVRREEKQAATHRTRLNKFLECQRKYF